MRVRGEFAPGAPPGLREALLDRFDRGGVLLKEGESRSVIRLEVAGGSVVAKRYEIRGWRRIGAWLRGNPARREYEAALALSRAGVPAVAALGWIARSVGWLLEEGIVALEDLGDAPTLVESLSRTEPGARRAALAEAGRLAAALHAARFAHGDFHAGNLLRRDRGTLLLFDLHRVRRAGSATARSRDLAFLLHSLRFLGETERARILRAYAAGMRRAFAILTREVLPVLSERSLRRARGAARNAIEARHGREAFAEGEWRGLAYSRCSIELREGLREESAGRGHRGWRSRPAGTARLWIRTDHDARARAAWTRLHALAALDVPVARPVAWLRGDDRSLLAVETPSDWVPLPAAFAARGVRERGALARRLGHFLRTLHSAGALAEGTGPEALFAGGEEPGVLVADAGAVRLLVPPDRSERVADALALARAFSPPLRRGELLRARRAFDPFGTLSIP